MLRRLSWAKNIECIKINKLKSSEGTFCITEEEYSRKISKYKYLEAYYLYYFAF